MTGNVHKKAARERQHVNGDSYTRARRAVANRHRNPLIATLGADADGNPVTLNLEAAPRGGHGAHCQIAGGVASGKTALASQICTSLVAGQKPGDLELIVSTFHPDRCHFPASATFTDGEPLVRMVDYLMGERWRRLDEARSSDPAIYDFDRYRAAGHRMPAVIVVFDGYDDNATDVGEMVGRIGQLGRACGVHLLVTNSGSLRSVRVSALMSTAVRLRSETGPFWSLGVGHGLLELPGVYDQSSGPLHPRGIGFTFPNYDA